MRKLYPIFMLQFLLITALQAQEDKKNFCLNCTRDLSLAIPTLVVDSIDISYCKKAGSSCVTISHFDVQYAENSCPR